MRVVLILALLARLAHAECAHDKRLPVARGTIEVDGDLSDPVWQTACFASDFAQQSPKFGAPPTHPVKVAVAIDDTTLYIGARMWSAPGEVDDALTQRDDTQQAERFIVSLDPSHTRRLAYSFAVTARGVRADWIHTDDTEGARDFSWNPVWIAQSRILPDGWSTEMAIPLSQLRLPTEPQTSWGIDFNWYVPHTNEDVFWIPVPLDRTAWASFFGQLTDLPPVHAGLGLELLPYVASALTVDESPSGAFAQRARTQFNAGLDVKLRPLPALTVTGTINPDFGQVDADPAFVNLTAYEVRLPEKRPFFVENNTLFANAPQTYFYSRRIGALPRALPAADEIDLPTQVRILGALAAGGYVAPETQVALLGAVTDETTATAVLNGVKQPVVVSPLSAWGAGRMEQQIGASVIGATATVVGRDLTPETKPLLASNAEAGGGDTRLRTEDGEYELDAYAGASHVHGSAAAITAIEETSTHYFQRPDTHHVHLDTDAHDLSGWAGGISATKRAGLWRGNVQAEAVSPGFEINDVGALQNADTITAAGEVRRTQTTPSKRVLNWTVFAGGGQGWDFGALRKQPDLHAGAGGTLTSFWNGGIFARVAPPGMSNDLTRGGPRMGLGWWEGVELNASSPPGRARQVVLDVEVDGSETLQQGVIATAQMTLRATSALRLDLAPSFTRVETHRQYVATVGDQYIFGHLHRTDAALELRATWSLSPDLVATLYAQPFLSIGNYDQLGQLHAPGSSQIDWFGAGSEPIARPDYRVLSVRSTAVVRWEFRPGSILYVVWQQARADAHLSANGIHTFAIKLSYWFG
ncbi:MAG: carbohydrate binding family 9 domain-containing protein [Deltaproteobacteria bacterium]|nr:carbohydrate binding family 9 domain-containing protein [Deltaproteobacteria bacterium]